jgi:hypothetical protein
MAVQLVRLKAISSDCHDANDAEIKKESKNNT